MLFVCLSAFVCEAVSEPWRRHAIDDSSRGADGVRLADANGDGLLDIVTGWEEGGVVRVYLNPGRAKAAEQWPAVTVGRARSVEDAVFADLDGDGVPDVVSSCEGKTRSLLLHWAPRDQGRYLEAPAWKSEALPAAEGRMQWMFCLPLDIDGRNGIDLVAGGKNEGAAIGWFESPRNPRQREAWRWHALRPVGWIMSIEAVDMDGDGDADIVFSDRNGPRRGCFWLERPDSRNSLQQEWAEHLIGGENREVMFLKQADLDRDGLRDVIVAAKPQQLLFLRRTEPNGKSWETHLIDLPKEAGRAKGVNVGDIDLDGRLDLVFSCEGAVNRPGVMWLSWSESPTNRVWQSHDISGPEGVKYDLVELIDLDGDDDLDVLTCEETANLGVIWYENPARQPRGR